MGKQGGMSTGEGHASICIKKKNLSGKMEERDRKIKEAEDEAVAVVQVTGDTRMGQCAVELKKRTDLRNGNKGESTGYGDRMENYPQLGGGGGTIH